VLPKLDRYALANVGNVAGSTTAAIAPDVIVSVNVGAVTVQYLFGVAAFTAEIQTR
jgi:hypothetical protein